MLVNLGLLGYFKYGEFLLENWLPQHEILSEEQRTEVRVFLEALFDAHEGLPALGPANGPAASGLDLGPWSLPAFVPPMGNVSEDDWNAMVTFNGQVAVNVEAVLTRVVEGLGPVSLNNQALEQILVEIFTTTTRKISEKASW